MIQKALAMATAFRNQRLSIDEAQSLQLKKLQAIVRHAYQSVPFYRSLYQKAYVHPDDIRRLEDIGRLPIVTKENLKEAGLKNIVSDKADLSRCYNAVTSGSTGKPFQVWYSYSDTIAYRAVAFRAILTMGLKPLDRIVILGITRKADREFYQRFGLFRSVNIHPYVPLEEKLRLIQTMNPTIFWFYPTSLLDLLYKSKLSLNEIVRPRAVFFGAEALPPLLRDRIKRELNVDIFSLYGAIEFGRIAAECPCHEGLHVFTDHIVLESLEPSRSGESGKLGQAVATGLNNFTMPLIRYRLNDSLVYKPTPCSCGSPFPLIDSLIGREVDMCYLPDGTSLSDMIYPIFNEFPTIHQYQAILETIDLIRVKVVFQGAPEEKFLSAIHSRIVKRLSPAIKVLVEAVDEIPQEGFKARSFISKLPTKTLMFY
jgi:phenylacetate-CoA ligase